MRKLKVDLEEVLDMIICAGDYGHDNCVIMGFFGDAIGELTNSEIEEFVKGYINKDGYTKNDRLSYVEELKEYRRKYINKKK